MKKNIKTTIFLILGAVTLMASVFIFILEVVFNNLPFSSKYGLVEISVNGKPLYFKFTSARKPNLIGRKPRRTLHIWLKI